MNNTIKLSHKKEMYVLAVVAALTGFAVAFLAAPFLLTSIQSVYGLKPGDEGYGQGSHLDGTPNTPYEDFMANGCLPKAFHFGDETVILDSKGLKELGLIWYDANTCFDVAKNTAGYDITNIKTDLNGDMVITLTKQPQQNNTNPVADMLNGFLRR